METTIMGYRGYIIGASRSLFFHSHQLRVVGFFGGSSLAKMLVQVYAAGNLARRT